ncbi:uncharacterized protein [Amphiura filiformis]|uniref:uncharacterized protein n=1 Tax=Amphiura filiformis TaxID=82378 RepID=UPI003B2242F8
MSAMMAWRLSFLLTVICLADHTEAFTTLPSDPVCNCSQPPPCLRNLGIFPVPHSLVEITCPTIMTIGPPRSVCVKHPLDKFQVTNRSVTDELDNGRQYCTSNVQLFTCEPDDMTTVNTTTTDVTTSYSMTTTSGSTSTDSATSTSSDTSTSIPSTSITSTSITSTSTDTITSTTDYTSTGTSTRPSCKNGTAKPCKDNRCRNCGWLVLLFLPVLLLLFASWYHRHKIRIWIRRCIGVTIPHGAMSSELLTEQGSIYREPTTQDSNPDSNNSDEQQNDDAGIEITQNLNNPVEEQHDETAI